MDREPPKKKRCRNSAATVSSTTELDGRIGSSRAGSIEDSSELSRIKIQLSTSGCCKINFPSIDGLDLGFPLPPTPTNIDEAYSYIRSALKRGGLPSRTAYQDRFDGLRQNRLLFRLLSYLRTCLALWTLNQPNESKYLYRGHMVTKYQIGPLPICFKTPGTRATSFDLWHQALSPEAREPDEIRMFMKEEFNAYAAIKEAVFSHRPNATNMYICSTQDHPAYGQSFGVRPLRDVDTTAYQELLSNDNARDRHSGRNGSGHEFVVLIDENHQAYIYDPSFVASSWTDKKPGDLRLGCAPFLKRAHELLQDLARTREKRLKRDVIVGGGGNQRDRCRIMAVKWFVERIAQWMGVRVKGVPAEPKEFAEGATTIKLRL